MDPVRASEMSDPTVTMSVWQKDQTAAFACRTRHIRLTVDPFRGTLETMCRSGKLWVARWLLITLYKQG